MALPSHYAIPIFLLVSLLSFISTAVGLVGVNYGRVANNLMSPGDVVQLLKKNSIGAVTIYDVDPDVLKTFSGTDIQMVVTLPNQLLSQAATSPAFAADWVRTNVAAYLPSTQIRAVAIGNEIFHCCSDLTPSLVPAMRNIAGALANQGLGGTVKVSTPVAIDVLGISFPPSDGAFRQELQSVMRDMLGFLSSTGSSLMINVYTYEAYVNDANVALDYALGRAQQPVYDQNTGLYYYSLLDAQIDAVYSAMGRLGYGKAAGAVATTMDAADSSLDVSLTYKETGWKHGGEGKWPPSSVRTGKYSAGRKAWQSGKKAAYDGNQLNASLAVRSDAATAANAQAYNANLIQRALAGKMGTPMHPDANPDVYIFSLFDENQKPPTERDYGLFYPDGRKVYDFSFQYTGWTPPPVAPPAQATWCEANPDVGRDRLQQALDWACGPEGKADCAPIQPGATCFQPNTVEAHCTYAFNSYYQQQRRRPSACSFNGAGRIVTQIPSLLQRDCHGVTWCVANPQVGTVRLQQALDWACGQGKADCGPIQRGAPCFEPNTLEAHATYAFNSYYQQHSRATGTCDFSGAASIVFQRPETGGCKLSP